MASLYVSPSSSPPLKPLALFSPPLLSPSIDHVPCLGFSSSRRQRCSCSSVSFQRFAPRRMARKAGKQLQVVAMAPEEEKLTRRNPLDFPIEWERPKPGRRPDIFPKFSPMKTPLPPPGPYDPPEEDEEEEEKKEEEKEEDDPEKEEDDQPEKQK